jgi:hypothetical protein
MPKGLVGAWFCQMDMRGVGFFVHLARAMAVS